MQRPAAWALGKVAGCVELLLGIGMAILLLSNMWLLREHKKTRARLEGYRAELNALEERVYAMLLEIQLGSASERSAEGSCAPDGESG